MAARKRRLKKSQMSRALQRKGASSVRIGAVRSWLKRNIVGVMVALLALLGMLLLLNPNTLLSEGKLIGSTFNRTYEGHYNEVPESNHLDWNGDLFFVIGGNGKVTGKIVTRGGMEFGNLTGIVDGTGLVMTIPPPQERTDPDACTVKFMGTFSKTADSVTGIMKCGYEKRIANWTASRVDQ